MVGGGWVSGGDLASLRAHIGWHPSPVAHHDLVDVSVTQEEGARQYVGRCRCGWDSDPVDTAVYALALVEDHGRRSRLRSRRRPDRTSATGRPAVPGPGADRSA